MIFKIKQISFFKYSLIIVSIALFFILNRITSIGLSEDQYVVDLFSQNTIKDSYMISEVLENKIQKIEKPMTRIKRVNSLLKLLVSVRSPIASQHYAELIIDQSESVNSDYRVIVAIMGTESGYCKKSFYYNCFGYLNGVKYQSYDDALSKLIPKIGKQYVNRYGWNFSAFVKAYGQLNDQAAGNLYSIASKLYY